MANKQTKENEKPDETEIDELKDLDVDSDVPGKGADRITEDESSFTPPSSGDVQSPTLPLPPPKKGLLGSKRNKILLALLLLPIVLGVLFTIPGTRYAMLGAFIKKDVSLTVKDATTDKPVSDADVSLAGQTAKTDNEGVAQFKTVPVGPQQATIKKTYYKEAVQTVNVWVTKPAEPIAFKVEATGRQVPVSVVNKISGKPVEKALVSALDSSTITDVKGEASIVLPADKTSVDGTVSLDGYNNASVKVQVVEQKDDKNTFSVTPAGKIYFLSKRSGTIDVMKSNLDGTDKKTVIKGTGKERQYETSLLATRDWKYLMLHARRDSEKAKLYLINTATDKMSVMDEGDNNISFSSIGWSNDNFVYRVTRSDVKPWQDKHDTLKSFNAVSGKLTFLDQTVGEGTKSANYAHEQIGEVSLLDNLLVYVKEWEYAHGNEYRVQNKKDAIMTVRPNGEEKKAVREFNPTRTEYIDAQIYKPQEVYFRIVVKSGPEQFYEYEDGAVKAADIDREVFYDDYPVYLLSPSGQKTFWSEPRDGKNTLFIGNASAGSAKTVLVLGEYVTYGWFSDDYLLASKQGSELYILPRTLAAGTQPLKVTDYHRTGGSYGYGYGYGGF